MSDTHYSNDYGGGQDDDSITSTEVNQAAANAFRRGAEAFGKAEIGKTKKFMGLITLDAGVADFADSLYNIGSDFLSSVVRPKIFGFTLKHGTILPGIHSGNVQTAAAMASIGSTAVFKTAAYFGPLYDGAKAHLNEQRDLAHTLSPILDDIKGNHSLAALYSTGIKDNEVIFAHRKRLGAIAHTKTMSNGINLAINSGTSLLLDVKTFGHIWQNRATLTSANLRIPAAAKPEHEAVSGHDQSNMATWQALKTGGVGMLPQLAKHIAATNEHKLKNELEPYSALEMIVELSEQVNSNPKASGFTEPRSFQSHHKRHEYSLEEYLMRICIQHQKDMAYIDPKYTEIREALRDDLAASVKPLAEEIRKGDFNVMGLVRLVGEGKIIKKQGRAIASAAEVMVQVKKEEPKHTVYTPIDPNDYYRDATFSRVQFKSAIKAMEGEEKRIFASMFPDSILTEAGMAKDEIKSIREATAAKYDHTLAEVLLALNAKSDEVLKTDGLALSEIEQIRTVAKSIAAQGETAVHELRTSAVNEHGIEHVLANVIVHQPKYLGKLHHEGHDLLRQQTANENDDHVERQTHRRANASHGQESYIS